MLSVLAALGGVAVGLIAGKKLYASRLTDCQTRLQSLRRKRFPKDDTPSTKLTHLVEQVEQAFDSLQLERDMIFERHDLITTNIAAAVVIRDTAGKIVFCSPYTQVLTGYTLDELYDGDGDFFARLVVEEDRPRYLRAQQVSALAEDISVKYRIQHRSGLKIWLETRLVPVCNEHGILISTMSVSIDVTDSLSYQKQIEEQNRDLSDFAYMVSHDLKAPIFTIKGMAAAMLEDHVGEIGEDGKQLMEYIISATRRLEQLVASVIEYSALATKDGVEEQVNLRTAAENALADQGEMVKSKHAEVRIPETLPLIVGNPVRLYQVFSNLLGNALKYSSPDRPPVITIEERSGLGNSIVIDVKDNGLGIPPGKLSDIFRPYHRAHGNVVEGSGIGLACVKKIMERMGGSVTVSSVEGKGSTFTLTFPGLAPRPRELPEDLARVFEQ